VLGIGRQVERGEAMQRHAQSALPALRLTKQATTSPPAALQQAIHSRVESPLPKTMLPSAGATIRSPRARWTISTPSARG